MAFQKGNTFVFGETPSASKWDQLWRNDDALAEGTGFDPGAIGTDTLAQSAVTPEKIGGWPAFAAYVASNYSSSTSLTIVQFATEEYDHGGHYDNSTYKFTAPYDGIYNFSAAVHISNVGDQAAVISLFRNTTQIRRGNQIQSNSSSHNQSHVVSADIQMLAGDTAEIRVQTASATRTINSGAFLSYFTGHLVTRTS